MTQAASLKMFRYLFFPKAGRRLLERNHVLCNSEFGPTYRMTTTKSNREEQKVGGHSEVVYKLHIRGRYYVDGKWSKNKIFCKVLSRSPL